MITHLHIITAAIFSVTHGTTSAVGNFVDKMVAHEDELNQTMEWDA